MFYIFVFQVFCGSGIWHSANDMRLCTDICGRIIESTLLEEVSAYGADARHEIWLIGVVVLCGDDGMVRNSGTRIMRNSRSRDIEE